MTTEQGTPTHAILQSWYLLEVPVWQLCRIQRENPLADFVTENRNGRPRFRHPINCRFYADSCAKD